ncbi:MAG: ABC transporter permease [Planctomycetaceae bacterium]
MRGWQIVKKDLRLMLRDRRALATLVVLPLIFITIIGLTTGQLLGWSDRNKLLKIAFVDETDPNELAEQVAEMQLPPIQTRLIRARNMNALAKLHNRLQKRDGWEVVRSSRETAERMMEKEKVNAVLVIGHDFFQRMDELGPRDVLYPDKGKLKDKLSSLDITLESKNPDSTTHALVEEGIFGAVLWTVGPFAFNKNAFLARAAAVEREEIEAEADAAPIPFDPAKPLPEAKSVVYQELIPSYTVMFVFFLVNIMARSFIQERELGTLRRLRVAPIGTTSLLSGKTLPFFIVSLVQTAMLFGCGKIIFGMSWGNQPWLLLPVIFCTSVSATTLGLLVATLVRTESQVSAYSTLVVIGLAGISGCFMPRDWLPDLMKEASLYTPHAWALIAYDQLLSEAVPNLSTVWECCGMLLGFGILFFCIGCLRFAKVAQ